MNKIYENLIELLNDWFEMYQEVYYEERELDKCKNLSEANGQWKFVSYINTNGIDTHVFENIYLKKLVQIENYDLIGFFPQQDYAFFIHNEYGKTRVEIGDLEYFQKMKAMSDWHISDIIVTPSFLDEVCEGSFYSEESVETTREKLLELGFVEDEEFSKFMAKKYAPVVKISHGKKM